MAIFFLCPSKQFLPVSFKFSCWKLLLKNRRSKDKSSADKLVTTQIWELKNLMSLFYWCLFPSSTFWILCNPILLLLLNLFTKTVYEHIPLYYRNICDRQHTVLIQYLGGPKFFTHNLFSPLFTFCQFRLLVVSLVAIIPPVERLYIRKYCTLWFLPSPAPHTVCNHWAVSGLERNFHKYF